MRPTESRYGTKSSALPFFPFLPSFKLALARAAMTFPNVVRDLLIFAPSLRRAPVAPVELARSEPAKSTKLWDYELVRRRCVCNTHLMRDTFSVSRFESTSCRFIVRITVNTACDRDDLN